MLPRVIQPQPPATRIESIDLETAYSRRVLRLARGNWPRAVWRLVQRRQSGGRLAQRLGAGRTGVVVVCAMLMAGCGPSRPGAMAMLMVMFHARGA